MTEGWFRREAKGAEMSTTVLSDVAYFRSKKHRQPRRCTAQWNYNNVDGAEDVGNYSGTKTKT